ncbi:hypothetical protein RFI_32800 [Reticulomyxa filosa]|uniref:Mitochondrial import inner membrane translocase subunit TIM50 n=1 Tax=Reticulomyxa filosa TaxID=46433 RepID=X6LTZ0_RETFI|nr:hypothetical protein RFI_32800 [Reticulomyxa filosa]|eukprot:ETO04597.1 hypothetical protein RFI_32800 [Reticulomyxa filosa]
MPLHKKQAQQKQKREQQQRRQKREQQRQQRREQRQRRQKEEHAKLEKQTMQEKRSILLPAEIVRSKKKLLVLDLDETMVYARFEQFATYTTQRIQQKLDNYDFVVDSIDSQGNNETIYVKKRPYLDSFLKKCSSKYDIIVFTASIANYANAILDRIDTNRIIAHRLFRDSVTHFGDDHYIKISFEVICVVNAQKGLESSW